MGGPLGAAVGAGAGVLAGAIGGTLVGQKKTELLSVKQKADALQASQEKLTRAISAEQKAAMAAEVKFQKLADLAHEIGELAAHSFRFIALYIVPLLVAIRIMLETSFLQMTYTYAGFSWLHAV